MSLSQIEVQKQLDDGQESAENPSILLFIAGVVLRYWKLTIFLIFWAQLYNFSSVKITNARQSLPKTLRTQNKKISQISWSGKWLCAVNTGDKRFLNKKERSWVQDLNLGHLLTPSGLHLAAPYLILNRFLKSQILHFLLAAFIWLGFHWNVVGFLSIKRILILRTGFCASSIFKIDSIIPKEVMFLILMTIEFTWGTYQQSPLSYCYSFVFLGALFLAKSKFEVFSHLYLTQVWVGYITMESISFWIPLINIIISSLFSLLFLPAFVVYWTLYFTM